MHVHNDTRQDECGLTLVELLIGVAIIGILVAIAVPGFMAYRHKSRVAVVVSTAGVSARRWRATRLTTHVIAIR